MAAFHRFALGPTGRGFWMKAVNVLGRFDRVGDGFFIHVGR